MVFENSFALNIAMIIGVIGVIVFIYRTQLPKTKKDQRNTLAWVAVIGIGVFLVGGIWNVPALTNPLTGGEALAVTTITPVAGVETTCQPGTSIEDTTVTFAALNAYTTAAVGGRHIFKVGSGAWTGVADAGTTTLSPGDELNILWGNGSTTTGNYFAQYDTVIVPCKGTYSPSDDANIGRLYQNGSFTLRIFNEEGNLIDAAGENETVANGDTVTLTADITGAYQRGLPYGGVMILEYDPTYFDDVIPNFGGSKTSVPTFYSATNTNNRTIAYTVPAILSNDKLPGTFWIDVHDTNNPAGSTAAAGYEQDIIIAFYANNYFTNEDKAGIVEGPSAEDEDNTKTFEHYTVDYLKID